MPLSHLLNDLNFWAGCPRRRFRARSAHSLPGRVVKSYQTGRAGPRAGRYVGPVVSLRPVSTTAAASPPHPAPPDSLAAIAQRAGAVLARDGQRMVAVHYGSAAGELAACLEGVGLGDRSQMLKLALHGRADRLQQLTARMTGVPLAPGGTARAWGGWWCAPSPERVIVLVDPGPGLRLRARLTAALGGGAGQGVSVHDRSDTWAALAVVGRRAGRMLADLGVYGEHGDARRAAPVSCRAVAGVPVLWLLESDRQAIAVMAAADAGAVWQAIARAGRALGLCAVGREALTRFALSTAGR